LFYYPLSTIHWPLELAQGLLISTVGAFYMITIDTYRPDGTMENVEAPKETTKSAESSTAFNKEDALKKLREQESKLNYLEQKGLTNEDVENIKKELTGLIKELEVLNV